MFKFKGRLNLVVIELEVMIEFVRDIGVEVSLSNLEAMVWYM